jgi:hypothetical protein
MQPHGTEHFKLSTDRFFIVERFFGLTMDNANRHGSFTSVQHMIKRIDHFVTHYQDCKPFVWTTTADSILAKLARLCARSSRNGTLVSSAVPQFAAFYSIAMDERPIAPLWK